MELQLTAPGRDTLTIGGDGSAFFVESYDLGFPEVRTVMEDRPAANGAIDTTTLYGARTLSFLLHSEDDATAADMQLLRSYLGPAVRATMSMSDVSMFPDVRASVRGSQLSHSVAIADYAGNFATITAQWVVADGVLESATENSETIYPGSNDTDGLEFDDSGDPLEFGPTLEFPLVAPPGTSTIENDGNTDAYPVVRLFGPFGDEGNASDETTIGNETTGKELVFTGMGVSAGDYVEIDFRAKTIILNGNGASKYSYLDFPGSEWWSLPPGSSDVAFRPDTFSGNAQALVVWRSAYI